MTDKATRDDFAERIYSALNGPHSAVELSDLTRIPLDEVFFALGCLFMDKRINFAGNDIFERTKVEDATRG